MKSGDTRVRVASGFGAFVAIWLGQALSLVGSRTSRFALGVWMYGQTGEATPFAYVALCDALPGLLLTPLSGLVGDRHDRRLVMLVSDSISALAVLALLILSSAELLRPWHLYAAMVVGSSASAFQQPAFSAAVPLIVPANWLGRASGLMQLAEGVAQLLSPALAGLLLGVLGLRGVLLVDLITFLCATAALLPFRFRPPPASQDTPPDTGSWWRDAFAGWSYLSARPPLQALLFTGLAMSLILCLVEVLVPVLLLGLTTPATMGLVVSASGVGALAGSAVMSAWGGPRRRVLGVLGFAAMEAVSLGVAGTRPSVPLLAAAGFSLMFFASLVWSCAQALWQAKVGPGVQARVFSIRRTGGELVAVAAYLLAGPLVDRVFEPLLAEGGPLARSVGVLLGTGPGRGLGLLFVCLGLLMALISVGGLLWPRLRGLDEELPDVTEEARREAPAGST
ncbi:MFS transporter [Cystobacter ferrugineus]|uniref:MFS transporter n=1 Tax=Cystobacter ferrugineus TaxID=83449 RepID=A0A1L9BF26_9BACT|nr:MFS transporter [Cystobacter ferrugineus]OJH40861.1 hypothetical protein BON30_08010 [Cystobacter ferrugineus]